MKCHQIFILFLYFFVQQVVTPVYSQTVNWQRLENSPTHVINMNAGLQHGVIYGIDYSYYTRAYVPFMFHLSISIPSEKK